MACDDEGTPTTDRSRPFHVWSYGSSDKDILLQGPGDFRAEVDYDDVFHEEVDDWIVWVVEVLNEAYAKNPPKLTKWDDLTCECGKTTNGKCAAAEWQHCDT
jgi:hypothetical protein